MTSNPLALQLYTLRDQLPAGRKAVLRAVRDFGYGAVEPYDVLTDPEALRADLDEAGLAVCSVHARALGEKAGPLLAGARAVGADTVIIPSVPAERFAGPDAVAALARDLNEAAAQAAARGLRLGYHNHAFELAPVAGRTGLEALAGALHPDVLLEVDTYWAAVGGAVFPGGRSPEPPRVGRSRATRPARRPGPLPARERRPGHPGRPDDRGRGRPDAGGGNPRRLPVRRVARGRARPLRH